WRLLWLYPSTLSRSARCWAPCWFLSSSFIKGCGSSAAPLGSPLLPQPEVTVA
ncbi:hypothetical protein, partial [Arthrobacter sp. DR-2P]